MQDEDMLSRVQILQKTQTKLFANGKGLMLIEAEVQEVHFLLVIKKRPSFRGWLFLDSPFRIRQFILNIQEKEIKCFVNIFIYSNNARKKRGIIPLSLLMLNLEKVIHFEQAFH